MVSKKETLVVAGLAAFVGAIIGVNAALFFFNRWLDARVISAPTVKVKDDPSFGKKLREWSKGSKNTVCWFYNGKEVLPCVEFDYTIDGYTPPAGPWFLVTHLDCVAPPEVKVVATDTLDECKGLLTKLDPPSCKQKSDNRAAHYATCIP